MPECTDPNHFEYSVIAALIVLFVVVPLISRFTKSKDAEKKFHQESEDSRKWRELLNDGERPMYRK